MGRPKVFKKKKRHRTQVGRTPGSGFVIGAKKRKSESAAPFRAAIRTFHARDPDLVMLIPFPFSAFLRDNVFRIIAPRHDR